MKIRNINPLGRVDVPLLRRQGDIEGEGRGCLEPGEVITVTAAIGAALLEQTTNFEAIRPRPSDGPRPVEMASPAQVEEPTS